MRANNSDVNRLFVFILFLFSAANSLAEPLSSSTGTGNYSRTTGVATSTTAGSTMGSTTGSMTGPDSLSKILDEFPLPAAIVFIAVAALCLIGLASILYTHCRRKCFNWQPVGQVVGSAGGVDDKSAGGAGGERMALDPDHGTSYGTASSTFNLRASNDDYTGPEGDDSRDTTSQSESERDTSGNGSSSASTPRHGSESE